MKTILSTIIALGLLGCLKPDDASLSFAEGDLKSSYVGTKKLRGALHQNRIYVISDLEFKSATFKLNGESLKAAEVARADNKGMSWHTPLLNPKVNDILLVDAKFSPTGENRLVLKVVIQEQEFQLVDITKEYKDNPVPDKITFPNDVDVEVYMTKFNEYRKRHGLRPMGFSLALTKAAAKNNPPQLRARRSGHFVRVTGGEIAFYGPSSIDSAIKGWHNSSGHRRLMQGNYNCTGIHRQGVAWTQRFANMQVCNDL